MEMEMEMEMEKKDSFESFGEYSVNLPKGKDFLNKIYGIKLCAITNEKTFDIEEEFKKLGVLQKEKESEYGDTYKIVGEIINILFRCKDFNNIDKVKLSNLIMIIQKIVRYSKNIENGHDDSLKDLIIYAMLQRKLHKDIENKEIS